MGCAQQQRDTKTKGHVPFHQGRIGPSFNSARPLGERIFAVAAGVATRNPGRDHGASTAGITDPGYRGDSTSPPTRKKSKPAKSTLTVSLPCPFPDCPSAV
jgi:hypothetical protein